LKKTIVVSLERGGRA